MIRPKAPSCIRGPLLAVLAVVVSACAGPGLYKRDPDPPRLPGPVILRLEPTRFDTLTGWAADRQGQALAPLLRSCEKIRSLPPKQALGREAAFGRVLDWLPICQAAALIRPDNETEAQYFFESRFRPYRVVNVADPEGLFTGYFEPELRGAWKQDTDFRYPLYAPPKDLVSVDLGKFRPEWNGEHIAGRIVGNEFVPYPSRADINQGMLKGRGLELLWVDSAIDAFFLHVQGSGRVVMPDGTVIRVAYAGRNGRRYTPIGRELVALGVLPAEQVTLQTIHAWLRANPVAATELMERNQSFIFFRINRDDGPIGAQGVVLTPGRSLAVDKRYIPLGVPIWLDTTHPGRRAKKPLRRVVVAQDTGSAIRGPVRGDLFVGYGTAAGVEAGNMKEKGSYYLLLPRERQP